jgi:hypothetical protein
MLSSYSNFVECFEKIKSFLERIKIFIDKNNSFKKLKAVQKRINETIIEKKINMPKFDFNKVLDNAIHKVIECTYYKGIKQMYNIKEDN